MTLDDAYYMVYKDLTSEDGMLTGKYDARHGNRHYMNGIWSVMELIAYKVGNDCGYAFNDRFAGNMAASEAKAQSGSEKPNKCETCKHYHLDYESIACERCLDGKYSRYEPKDEPQTKALFTDKDGDVWEWRGDSWYCISGDEPQQCYLRTSCDHYGDKQVCGRCREYNLYSHTKTKPQTDDAYAYDEDDWYDKMEREGE